GDGAKLCYNTMKEKNNNKVFLSEEYFSHPFASAIAYCGAKSIVDGQAINADELIPLYIQIPQAQRELEAKLNFQNK
ncbi:MAG: tRNA (adenosine(37)-N6)-threonylcarbamoyltransferase complex dimerization subunit type 1 TsaB, partial [Oscillospiraceae bacterium]